MEIPRTFEVRYRVRFDEASVSGNVRPSGLLRYAQDLAWQHSEAVGFDRSWYDERGTSWVVRMVALRQHASVSYGDTVTARTRVTGWRRVWARRHTIFDAADGQCIAEVDTDWVLLTRDGRPSRIPDEISRFFAPGSVYKPERVDVGPTPPGAAVSQVEVRSADVDPLGHLNNAAYVDILDEARARAGAGLEPASTYRVEFIRPARPETVLRTLIWSHELETRCRFEDEAGMEVCKAVLA